MGDVAKEGRTILFVSHNMAAIRSLCKRAVLLDEGKIVIDGTSDEVIDQYMKQKTLEKASASADEIEARMEGVILRSNPHIRFVEITMIDASGELKQSFNSDEPIYIKITFRCIRRIHDLRIIIELTDEKDTPLLLSLQVDEPDIAKTLQHLDEGIYETICEIPPNLLGGKTFYITTELECPKTEHLVVPKILCFEVKCQGYNNVHLDYPYFFRPQFKWQMHKSN
jgi:lipopolysaccharide transport system ATP-binding protein